MQNYQNAAELGRSIIAEHLIEGGPGDPDALELAATLCNFSADMLATLRDVLEILRDSWGDEQLAAGDDQAANLIIAQLARIEGPATPTAQPARPGGDALPPAVLPVLMALTAADESELVTLELQEAAEAAGAILHGNPAPTDEAEGLERHTMLALSTVHLRPETCNAGMLSAPVIAYEKRDYGWFCYVPEAEQVAEGLPDYPADLAACLTFASAHGFGWVMFDCDADTVDGLPIYAEEWASAPTPTGEQAGATGEVLPLYRQLADGLSDMIEGDYQRLCESDCPDDWAWLTNLLEKIATVDPGTPTPMREIRDQHGKD